jgi:hypothetical protein
MRTKRASRTAPAFAVEGITSRRTGVSPTLSNACFEPWAGTHGLLQNTKCCHMHRMHVMRIPDHICTKHSRVILYP